MLGCGSNTQQDQQMCIDANEIQLKILYDVCNTNNWQCCPCGCLQREERWGVIVNNECFCVDGNYHYDENDCGYGSDYYNLAARCVEEMDCFYRIDNVVSQCQEG